MARNTVTVPASELIKFAQLADLLSSASRLAHEISQAGKSNYQSTEVLELKRPKNVPKDQEWFWSKEWQKWEKAADEDIAAGRVEQFDNIDDLIAALNL